LCFQGRRKYYLNVCRPVNEVQSSTNRDIGCDALTGACETVITSSGEVRQLQNSCYSFFSFATKRLKRVPTALCRSSLFCRNGRVFPYNRGRPLFYSIVSTCLGVLTSLMHKPLLISSFTTSHDFFGLPLFVRPGTLSSLTLFTKLFHPFLQGAQAVSVSSLCRFAS